MVVVILISVISILIVGAVAMDAYIKDLKKELRTRQGIETIGIKTKIREEQLTQTMLSNIILPGNLGIKITGGKIYQDLLRYQNNFSSHFEIGSRLETKGLKMLNGIPKKEIKYSIYELKRHLFLEKYIDNLPERDEKINKLIGCCAMDVEKYYDFCTKEYGEVLNRSDKWDSLTKQEEAFYDFCYGIVFKPTYYTTYNNEKMFRGKLSNSFIQDIQYQDVNNLVGIYFKKGVDEEVATAIIEEMKKEIDKCFDDLLELGDRQSYKRAIKGDGSKGIKPDPIKGLIIRSLITEDIDLEKYESEDNNDGQEIKLIDKLGV